MVFELFEAEYQTNNYTALAWTNITKYMYAYIYQRTIKAKSRVVV